MASSITFTGLGSGLDTASIVSQLMVIEAAPQNRLKTALATQQGQISALQQLNTSLAALRQSADSFSSGSTWSKLNATSSSSAVKITATSSATPASLAITVNQAATAPQNTYAGAAQLGDVVTTASALDVTLSDGTVRSVDVGDRKLSTVISSLNALKDANGTPLLSATAIGDPTNGYHLVVTQLATGAGDLSVTEAGGTALMGGTSSSTTGLDAKITAGAVTLTQHSNTFKSLMPGVDVTVSPDAAAGTKATLTVSDDGSSRANALNTFVSQINQVIDQVASTTSYGKISAGQPATGAGALPGDSTLRSISDRLLNAIFPGGGATMAKMGLDLDSSGHLTFDQSAFQSAYQANPAAVQTAFIGTGGFTSRVSDIAKMASDPSIGTITKTLAADNDEVKRYNEEIAAWDDRLATKQASLTRQFSVLEVTLSRLQSQSSWLTTQLNSLNPKDD